MTNGVESQSKVGQGSPKPLKDQSNIQNGRNTAKVSTSNLAVQQATEQAGTLEGSVERERPLKCLETLAQKAGISLDDKYELGLSHQYSSSSNGCISSFNLDKSQGSSQGHAPNQVPMQISNISQEQLQSSLNLHQLQQQLQLQALTGTIQVKQEFPNQQQNAHMSELKPQILDVQQQHIQQMQVVESQPQSPHHPQTSVSGMSHQGATTINTLSPLQAMQAGQMSTDWQQSRLQVLPQTIQNPQYLQQVYTTTTGQPVVMSGNILHPGISGQQQIQLIAAGKAFQGPQIATQQMLATTAQGKQVLQTTGATGSFGGHTFTLPTIPSSQSQTLVLSPYNVIGSQPQQQQQNLIPTIQQSQTGKQMQAAQTSSDSLQKQFVAQKMHMQKTNNVMQQGGGGSGGATMQQGGNQQNPNQQQCVQVSQTMPTAQIISPLQQQGQTMQFTTPWLQGTMPFWTNGIQSQTLLAPNSILIRGTNPDGSPGMFLQQAPQQATQQQIQTQQQNRKFKNARLL